MSSPTLRTAIISGLMRGVPVDPSEDALADADCIEAAVRVWLTAPEQAETLARARYAAGSPVRDKDDNALAWDDLGPLLRKHLIADTALTLDVLARLAGEASDE